VQCRSWASHGPLLLSAAKGLTKDVSDEVKRLHPTGAYVLGGATGWLRFASPRRG